MNQSSIIQALIEKKLINAHDISSYEQQAAEQKKSLLSFLIDENIVSAQQIYQQQALSYNIPYFESIAEKMIDPGVLSKIPLKFLRQNIIIPLKVQDQLTIATADPAKFQPLDEVGVIIGTHNLALASPVTIIDALNKFYPLEGTKQVIEELDESKDALDSLELQEIEQKDILTMASEAPIIKLVNHIFVQAVKRGASDIHIEPYEKEIKVRYRIDGIMYQTFTSPKRVQPALVSRIKIMAHLNIAEKRLPQDGRIQIKVVDKSIDIRVSILPVNFGERVVMRLLDKSKTFNDIESLGFSDADQHHILQAIARSNGILYISGPTGSGKTSTLYSLLNKLNTDSVTIVTVEDPVEYQMQGIAQVQVNEKINLTFANALRSILRQDPDIIMIGETRDAQTAQIAIQAALTGHLVLSTIHTNNAPASITRLIDMGIEPFLISSSIVGVVAQRLVRKLCTLCKVVGSIPQTSILDLLGISVQEASLITFYSPVGCEECNQSGYKGRLAIFEVMMMSPTIAKLTTQKSSMGEIRKQAIAEGMTLLVQDGIAKIKQGLTTPQEVIRVAINEVSAQDE